MIYLYIKTHNKTGLQYLGKTVSADPHKYTGSGTYWILHLKKHGYDYSTAILFQSEDPAQIKEKGIYYSQLWDIVKSDKWANLKEECGDGGKTPQTAESHKKRSVALTGRPLSEEHKRNLSIALKGRLDTRTLEAKAAAGLKASAKLKGKAKPDGFGNKIRERNLGKIASDATKEKMKLAWSDTRRQEMATRSRERNNNKLLVTCPHCNKTGKSKMEKYHFDNCYTIKPKLKKVKVILPRASSWCLLSPSGELVTITNMREFCRDNDLNNGTMSEVAAGNRKHHKGWKVTAVIRDDDRSCEN